MAKKRKLNKRAVAVLIAVGAVVVLAAFTGAAKYLFPHDPAVYGAKADAAFKAGDLEDAEKWYAIAAASDDPNYLYQLARTRWEFVDPRIDPPKRSLTPDQVAEKRRGLFDALRKAIRLDANYLEPQKLLCEVQWEYFRRGWIPAKDFLAEADRLLQIKPNDPNTLFRRGSVKGHEFLAGRGGDANEAVEDFRRALELQPGAIDYWRTRIEFLRRTGREAEADQAFEEAVARNDADVALRIQYAGYLHERKRVQDAFGQIDAVIQRDPNDIEGHLARAEHLLRLGDPNVFPEARKALETAMGIDDSGVRVYQLLAGILLREDRSSEAREKIREGIDKVSARLAATPDANEVRRLEEAAWQMHAALAGLLLELHGRQRGDANALDQVQECLGAMDRLAPDYPGRARVAGLLAHARGDLPGSVSLLREAMKQTGGDARVVIPLLDALTKLDRPAQVLDVLKDWGMLPRRPGPAAMAVLTADARMLARDYSGADVEIARALQDPATRPQAQNLKAILDVLAGNRFRLPNAVTLTPIHANRLLDRVPQLLSEGRGPEAIGLLEDLHRESPRDRRVIRLLLSLYLSGDRPREDRAEEIRAEFQSSDPALAAWIGEEIDLRKQKDPNQRYQMLAERLERLAGESFSEIQKELELARLAAQEGLTQVAEEHLQAAARIDPNHPRVVDLFFVRALQRDPNEAEEWARRAAAVNADGVGGHLYAARLAYVRREFPLAIDHLSKALQRQPDSAVLRAMLGECYLFSNEPEKARAEYEHVLRRDPSFFPAVKGMALVTAGKPSEHEDWVEKASRLPRGSSDPYIQRESVKLIERRADPNTLPQVIDRRLRILRQDPANLDNYYQLGRLFEYAKHQAEAEGLTDRARLMDAEAERMFRAIYERVAPASKLDGARPLAEYYGRCDRLGDLTALLGQLGDLRGIDPIGLQILSGDSLSYLDSNKAESAYTKAIEKNRLDPRGHSALGRFYQRQGRWPEAVGAYRQYQELVPANASARLLTAYAQIQANEANEAGRALSDILAKDPANADALGLRGILAMKQKRYDDAEKDFNAALQGGTQNVGALLGRARIYLIRGQPEKARRDLQSVRLMAGDTSIHMEYAMVCQFLGDLRSAETVYREVLSRQRDYAPAMLALAELYLSEQTWTLLDPLLAQARRKFPSEPSFLLVEARGWKARKEPQKFLDALRAAAGEAPDSIGVVSEYLVGLLEEQRWAEARDQAEQSAAKPSLTAVALAAKGRALVRLGRGPEAAAAFRDVLRSAPPLAQVIFAAKQASLAYPSPQAACEAVVRWGLDGNLPALHSRLFLGAMHLEAKDFPAAARELAEARSATAASPSDRAMVGVLLGLAHYQAKNFPQAEQVFLEVLRVSPDELQVLNNLAYLYANDLKDPNRALPHARKALELAVGNANVVDTYGWVLVQLKRYTEAIEVLGRAVALAPSHAVFRYHLGYAFEQDGRLEEALRQYTEGLRVCAPDDDATRADLQAGAERLRKRP